MRLGEATAKAEHLALAGDAENAAAVLAEASNEIVEGEDLDALRRFVGACHRWAERDVEEVALRALLARLVDIDGVLGLLDVLQQRINTLRANERIFVATECVQLGTVALRLLGEGPMEETRADLYYCRGLRHLDLAREGQPGHLDHARRDISQFVGWLQENKTVPEHLRRGNLAAFAEVDLAESLILGGRKAEAATLLEGAIAALEGARVAGWMTKRAYSLLERAWEP